MKCRGNGRKQRVTPLTKQTVAALREWLRERAGSETDRLFPSVRGGPRSVDAIQRLLAKHVASASPSCSSQQAERISPHVLRHTCAVNLLRAGVDLAVIGLRFGHSDIRTTMVYLSADLTLKERALARTTPPDTPRGRYRPPDKLLAFLEGL